MAVLASLFASNLVQLALTFGAGSLLATVQWRDVNMRLVKTSIAVITPLIFLSFMFNVGEVYQYAPYYKRAFAIFGDDSGTILVFLSLLAAFLPRPGWYFAALTAFALAFGKMALIIFVVSLAVLAFLNPARRAQLLKCTALGIVLALTVYFTTAHIGNIPAVQRQGVYFVAWANNLPMPSTTDPYAVAELNDKIRASDAWFKIYAGVVQSYNPCADVGSCILDQSRSAMRERFISSIGGLWMTLQGGYRGTAYPKTPQAFADLMMQANPWNINNKLQLTHKDWYNMAMPQNPYMHFGSGYGYLGLGVLLFCWVLIAVAAVAALHRNPNETQSAFCVFFIAVIVLNQTQTYITSFSPILFVLGLSAGMIALLARHGLKKP